MKAARILRFGPPSVITNDDLPRPEPAAGQLLVRVKAAGVGNWDALIREGKVELQPLPLTLGSELSGIVEAIGAEISGFKLGDGVYGATNEQFSGAYAEYALTSARMMAQKPKTLNFIEAASASIVTVTAWQMLFDYAHVTAGQNRTYPWGRRQRWRLCCATGQAGWPSCNRDRRLRGSRICQGSGC